MPSPPSSERDRRKRGWAAPGGAHDQLDPASLKIAAAGR